MSTPKPTVVTTRYWNNTEKNYDDYNTKYGLHYASELKRYMDFVPYIHVHDSRHVELFCNKKFAKYVSLTRAFDSKKEDNYIKETNNILFNNESISNEVILYVHGFNNSIDDAEKDANSIANTGRKVVVYDWASTSSRHKIVDIARSYAKDAEAAMASVRPLIWLLHVLLSMPITLHILCHSMGSRIVVESLKSLAHDYTLLKNATDNIYEGMLIKINCIIFKQPDIDIVNMSHFWFKEVYKIGLINNKLFVRIFAHNNDKALNTSQLLHLGILRVGQFNEDIVKDMTKKHIIDDVDLLKIIKKVLIDSSKYCNNEEKHWAINPARYYGFENHSYFENIEFINDLTKMLDESVQTTDNTSKRQKTKSTEDKPYSVLFRVFGL